jgi:pimeloyl-ACP methyl ester carboxylesterase
VDYYSAQLGGTVAEAFRDVIVVVPGIMGSTLARRDGDKLLPVWAPSARGIVAAIRTLGESIKDLKFPDWLADAEPGDGIEPTGLFPNIHLVPGLWSIDRGYSRLLGWLHETFELSTPGNLIPFGYDWRLSCMVNARRLKAVVEPVLEARRALGGEFKDAQLVIICHSMGGLVARWYVEHLGGSEVTRKVITIGTPHRGSVVALDKLVNGLRVGMGPLAIDLTELARSLPSMYELLPAYQSVAKDGTLHAPHEVSLPVLSSARVRWAREEFHDKLADNPTLESTGYTLHPIIGTRQPTWTSADWREDRVVPSYLIDGKDLAGDGTVPRLAATPRGVSLDSAVISGFSEQHGSLQHHPGVFEQLYTALTGTTRVYLDDESSVPAFGVTLQQIHLTSEPIIITANVSNDKVRLRATVTGEDGKIVASELLWRQEVGVFSATLENAVAPGAYEVRVDRDGPTANPVQAVSASTLVWDPAAGGGDNGG